MQKYCLEYKIYWQNIRRSLTQNLFSYRLYYNIMEDAKQSIEKILRDREWITFNDLLKNVPYSAPTVYSVLTELIKENKVGRRGRYFYYIKKGQ
ncbi:MAG: hypothetical protein QW799_01290 [Saccharolobus sp.]